MNHSILHINSSSRLEGSLTRTISGQLVKQLQQVTGLEIVERELAEGLPFINENWISANFTEPEARDEAHKAALSLSDSLVRELQEASHIVIAVPIYNFSVPAVLKAWVDQVARARVTFRYTNSGPEGLLKGKKAYLVLASGGVELGSESDFASTYMRHIMHFLGIDDVSVINANELSLAANESDGISDELVSIAAASVRNHS